MSKRRVRRWPLYLIGSSAAVAVWSGWVGLGTKSGFGIVHPLPGILPSFYLNTAITLPIGVEAYGAYAMGAWMSPDTPKTARTFARRSAIGALLLGMLGQISYHLLAAFHVVSAPWPIVMAVSCIPVVTLGFAAALIHLLHLEQEDEAETPLPPSPVAGPSIDTMRRIAETLPDVVSPRPQPPGEDIRLTPREVTKLEEELDEPARPMPRLRRTLEGPAPWDDEQNWTRPVSPQAAPPAPEPDTQIGNQVHVGSVSVRSPLGSRLDRKIPVEDRVTGSFPAIRD